MKLRQLCSCPWKETAPAGTVALTQAKDTDLGKADLGLGHVQASALSG
jgi:hypothetical protein